MNGFWYKFFEVVGYQKDVIWFKDILIGTFVPIIRRRVNNVKNGGLEGIYTPWVLLIIVLF